MADKISELTNFTPPIDANIIPIVDTTAGATKGITWASIKAALKTYFDSLATTLTNKTLTSPKINENVALIATASELNTLDGSLPRKSIIYGSNLGATIAAGETKYIALGVGATAFSPAIRIPMSGTLKNLTLYGYNPGGSSQTLVATVMITNSATALTGTINTGANEITDSVHTAGVTANDFLSLRIVLSASAATLAYLVFSIEFDAG